MAKMEEKRLILTIAGIAGVLTLASLGGVYYADDLITETQTEIQSTQKRVKEANGKIKQIPGLEDRVIILRENVETYSKILPAEDEVHKLARTISGFMEEINVPLLNWKQNKAGKKQKGQYRNFEYQFNTKATLWQALQLLSRIESHDRFIKVKRFRLKPSKESDQLDPLSPTGDAVHDLAFEIETYIYRAKGGTKPVEIKRYGKRRELLQTKIEALADAVKLERVVYSEQPGRRDVFVDPRPQVGRSGVNPNRIGMMHRLEEAEGKVEEMRGEFTRWQEEENYLQQDQIRRALLAELDLTWEQATLMADEVGFESVRSQLNSNVLIPVREMMAELRGDGEGPAIVKSLDAKRIERLISDMRTEAANGDFQAAIDRYDELETQLVFPDADPRENLALEARKLRDALETTLEFEKIQLNITGQVVFEESQRGLLINGQAFLEGEQVTDELLLYAVRVHEADFLFRNLILTKRW